MNRKSFFLFITILILMFILGGCSSSKYPYDKPIEMIVDHNIRNNLLLLPEIPKGWFVAEDESIPSETLLLLLEEKYRAAVLLNEIKVSKNAKEIVAKKGIEELAKLSFEMKKEEVKDSLILCSEFNKYDISDKDFISYHYKPTGSVDTACTIVFKKSDVFYELNALFLKKEEKDKHFTTRDSLLAIQYNILKKIIDSK